MSFTMKKVPEVHSQVSDSGSTKGDAKISSFSCRADVIYKKILRDFRRYYINDFQEVTHFKNCKNKGREFVIRCLEQYSQKRFGKFANRNQVIFALGSLIAPAELTRANIGRYKKPRKEVNKIHDTLYKFSITKVDKLLDDKSVAFLLEHFILNSSVREDLIGLSEVSAKSYETAFNMILSRSEV